MASELMNSQGCSILMLECFINPPLSSYSLNFE
nr:MAG TPA: hypothetical protein [Caudoviricetes sp.]